MTGLVILMTEMPHSRLTTPLLPVAQVPPGVPAEQALAPLLRLRDDAVERLTPWLDAHPAPEGDSAHARIEFKRWEEAHRAARDTAWDAALGCRGTSLEWALIPKIQHRSSIAPTPRIVSQLLPCILSEIPA